MSDAVVFPSVTWFEKLAEAMRADLEGFKELGPIDCAMVVQVTGQNGDEGLYEVVFEGYGVRSIRQIEKLDQATPSHFVIEGSLASWREMIDNIRTHGAADLEHTLNYLTFPDDPMRVSGPDQLEIDAFYRYNQSLQRFFNKGCSRIETRYAD